jgi:hypothetical protein
MIAKRSTFDVAAIAAAALLMARPSAAQTVRVTVPAGVSFVVANAAASTAGSPATTPVTYSQPKSFAKTDRLRISVRADASAFAGPGTTHPAASTVSWTATATDGTASNGTLSPSAYTQVYQSNANLKATDSATISLSWTLASILAPGLRAGTHTLAIRWKFEAF